jgi:hypothetical protein
MFHMNSQWPGHHLLVSKRGPAPICGRRWPAEGVVLPLATTAPTKAGAGVRPAPRVNPRRLRMAKPQPFWGGQGQVEPLAAP